MRVFHEFGKVCRSAMWVGKDARVVQEVPWGWGRARDGAVQVEKGVQDVLHRPGRIYSMGLKCGFRRACAQVAAAQIQKSWGGFASRGDMC